MKNSSKTTVKNIHFERGNKKNNLRKEEAKEEKSIPLILKILIPIFVLLMMEFFARGLEKTVLKSLIDKADLKTKFEKIYIPPPEPLQDNVLRLYVYGASTTFGFPVPEIGFVPQLSDQLHHIFPGKSIDVKNLGWSGYTSTMDRYVIISTFWHRPDAMVIYTSHNEFVHPEIDLLSLYRGISNLRDRSGLFKLLMAMSSNLGGQSKPDNLEPIDRKRVPYFFIKPYYNLKINILKKNYSSIAKIASDNKIPVIFITAASNAGDWEPPELPVVILSNKNYYYDLNKVRSLIKNNQINEAQIVVDKYLKKDPNDSYFLIFQGKIEEMKNNWNKAELDFEKAKNLDPLQWRANEEINNFIRSLADGKYVWVIDAEKIFKENSPNNITDFTLFLDNVHPNPDGGNLLANSIVDFFQKSKIVKPDWWQDTKERLTKEELFGQINLSEDNKFKLEFLTALYCIKNPFFNFNCAENYLKKAEEIKPNDWEIPASRAVIAYLKSDIDEAKRQYKIAWNLNQNLDNNKADILKIPYLLNIQEKLK